MKKGKLFHKELDSVNKDIEKSAEAFGFKDKVPDYLSKVNVASEDYKLGDHHMALAEEKYAEAMKAILAIQEDIHSQKFQYVLSAISLSRSFALESKRRGLDQTEVFVILSKSRDYLKEGKFVKALKEAERARLAYEKLLSESDTGKK